MSSCVPGYAIWLAAAWRFGYLRLFILLRREGEPSDINRIYRLYSEEDLARRRRRRGAKPWEHARQSSS
jgi:hypothetical protein